MPRPGWHISQIHRETAHAEQPGLAPELDSVADYDAGPTPVVGPFPLRILTRPCGIPLLVFEVSNWRQPIRIDLWIEDMADWRMRPPVLILLNSE